MDLKQVFRVYNKCKYDIGVITEGGTGKNIKAGSFTLLTGNDILYINDQCSINRFFSKRMLVPVDENGREIAMSEFLVDEDPMPHLNDEMIETQLKLPIKKLQAWLDEIDDPSELHAIYETAKKIDLPSSKLKILSQKMPDKDWLDRMQEE